MLLVGSKVIQWHSVQSAYNLRCIYVIQLSNHRFYISQCVKARLVHIFVSSCFCHWLWSGSICFRSPCTESRYGRFPWYCKNVSNDFQTIWETVSIWILAPERVCFSDTVQPFLFLANKSSKLLARSVATTSCLATPSSGLLALPERGGRLLRWRGEWILDGTRVLKGAFKRCFPSCWLIQCYCLYWC